ncbi:hypothetical protein GCM10023142_03160 [Anaerocolumna aminovalerica]
MVRIKYKNNYWKLSFLRNKFNKVEFILRMTVFLPFCNLLNCNYVLKEDRYFNEGDNRMH